MLKFSIIVVCLNPGEKLRDTLNSIEKQSYPYYEVIIKDGGSTDGSVESVPETDRIKIFNEKDTGIYDAMNQAAAHMSGDYCIFLNCGDYFYDEKVLERTAGHIQNSSEYHGIYYGDIYDRLRNAHISSAPEITPFVCFRNIPCHQACFYSKDTMKKRLYDTRYKVRADYDHFLGCFFEDEQKPEYIGTTVASYEGGGYSETEKGLKISAAEREEILRKYLSDGEIRKFNAYMALSLAPLRKAISENPKMSKAYQGLKSLLYGLKK